MVTRNHITNDKITHPAYKVFLSGRNEAWRRMPRDYTFDYQSQPRAEVKRGEHWVSQNGCMLSGLKREKPTLPNPLTWGEEFLYDEVNQLEPNTIVLSDGECIKWQDSTDEQLSPVGKFVIVVPAGAQCVLEETTVCHRYLRSIEIHVEEGGKFTHICHMNVRGLIEHTSIYLAKNAVYECCYSAIGDTVNRRVTRVFLEEDSQCSINGLVTTETAKTKFQEMLQFYHQAPNAQVIHNVKSIVADASSIDTYSTITIPVEGQGAITDQNIQHLLLSNKARAFSKPALNIQTQHVASQHGALSSMIDDKLLFYMESRGLDKSIARKLYLKGYIDEACKHAGVYAGKLIDPIAKLLEVGDAL